VKSLKQNLEFFFLEHEKALEENYPGLTFEHLSREFLVFAQTLRDFDENLLSTPFCSLKKEDVERFYSGLIKGIPLQQITGKAYFYRSEFLINRHVLIPRPESEILVSMAVAIAQKNKTQKILELGIGSGCLMISLLRELDFPLEAWGIDISIEALEMARRNAFRLRFSIHRDTKINFLESDLSTKLAKNLSFPLIISNPPYIKESQKKSVHHTVDNFEPKVALYISDEEYLNWYIRFFKEVFFHLERDGILIMEGHEENLPELQNLARQQGLKEVELFCDYTSRLRFLTAKK
jgi:release factor glutamine methyltransferase